MPSLNSVRGSRRVAGVAAGDSTHLGECEMPDGKTYPLHWVRNDACRRGIVTVSRLDGSLATVCLTGEPETGRLVAGWLEDMPDLDDMPGLTKAIWEVISVPRTRMVDLQSHPRFQQTKPKPKPKPAHPDRIDKLCESIDALVGQMAVALEAGPVDDVQVELFARKYGLLTTEVKSLREKLRRAEGMFEVAQKQVVQMMLNDEA